jgi:hypothetical protein
MRKNSSAKITQEIVLSVANQCAADNQGGRFRLTSLWARVVETLDASVSRPALCAIVEELVHRRELGITKVGRETFLWRYTESLRQGWAEAERLASQLGGTHHGFTDERVATVELTLEQARALAARVSDDARG